VDVDVDVVVAVAAMQDKYILSSMALLCCVCLWHAIVPYIQSRLVDVVVLATFACVYLLSHLAFYIFIYVVVSTPAIDLLTFTSSSVFYSSPLAPSSQA